MSALSSFRRPRAALLAVGLALAALAGTPAPVLAAEPAAVHVPPPQNVLLRVHVNAEGKVVSSSPLDENTMPVILQAAQQIASKLTFTPARKNGRATVSETTLVVTLGFEAQPAGGFGISLLRAQNGPSVVEIGKAQSPKVPKTNGGIVVVGADLRADGSVDIDSFKVEKVELRVPSEFDQSQYEKAARVSLKDTRFMLDKVDGIEIPSRIAVAFMFNGGAEKRDERRGEGEAKEKPTPPSMTATSKIEGIELSKIDYTAPAK